MSTPASEVLRLRLRRDPSAPGLAREALEQLALEELHLTRPLHDDALLVASELATNAVARPTAEPDGEIELVADLVHDGLRLAVTDCCIRRQDAPFGLRRADDVGPAGFDGLGLRIIQALSRRWGTERLDGRRMWAVLSI